MPSVQVGITDTLDDVLDAGEPELVIDTLAAGFVGIGAYDAGLRFQALTGPGQGATISSATLTLNVQDVVGTPNTTFYGVDVDDAGAWAKPGNLPGAAARTTASVAGPTATGTQVVDVTAIVQEIVNRAGWASGNDIAFVAIDNAGSGPNYWLAEDYSFVVTSPAVLDVTYVGSLSGLNLERRLSTTAGAAGDSTASTPAGSLGKYMSTTKLASGVLGNLFDEVTGQEAETGRTDYRCLFVVNTHPSETAYDVSVWIASSVPGGADISIGLDTSVGVVAEDASAAQAETIATETTAPAGVSFSAPGSLAAAHVLGDLAPGYCRAIWVRRKVPAGAHAQATDGSVLTFYAPAVQDDSSLLWSIAPSPSRIAAALTGPNVRLTYRFEKRSLANAFLADISPYVIAAQVDGNNDRAIFATARFSVLPGSGLNTLADHVAPIYRLLVDGSYWYEDQLGLFALTVPQTTYAPNNEVQEIGANDLCIHLMERTLTAAHTVASGANYVSGTGGVRALLDLAGLRHAIPATTLTLPADRTWPIGTPLLTVVNDLLQACNMYSCWAERDGTIVSRTSTALASRTPDATYTGSDFILSPVKVEADTTRFANQVVVVSEDTQSGVISSTATNIDPSSPTSTVTLGRTITKVVRRSVADQTTADAIAAAELQEAGSLYRRAAIAVQPDPRRWAHEVLTVDIDGVLASEPWWVRSWTLPLKNDAQMSMNIAKVEKVGA